MNAEQIAELEKLAELFVNPAPFIPLPLQRAGELMQLAADALNAQFGVVTELGFKDDLWQRYYMVALSTVDSDRLFVSGGLWDSSGIAERSAEMADAMEKEAITRGRA
jgi:hypothetical protein